MIACGAVPGCVAAQLADVPCLRFCVSLPCDRLSGACVQPLPGVNSLPSALSLSIFASAAFTSLSLSVIASAETGR
eukprot:CAMPEP_0185459090 /NCGR_PEP_ID=MMETSP1365-20130426/83957_1 /TAXON_ID=38817 /ORGANISM="Gephyrocapsa oceanica, Strain RCC1303" /LENGTH=75 /DNA_ID=CAMNT_0028065621 /DNA_START=17 /DNA_END=241 /DNA_ORIENTATION=-